MGRSVRLCGGIPAGQDAALAVGGRASPLVVLVVDDEPAVLKLLVRCVARCGFQVLAASGAGEALALMARCASLDLLVTDVVMPQMTGPALYARLVRRIPGLRVVYISGYTGSALRPDDPMPGGAVFLGKPFTPAQVQAAIHQAVGTRPGPAVVPAEATWAGLRL